MRINEQRQVPSAESAVYHRHQSSDKKATPETNERKSTMKGAKRIAKKLIKNTAKRRMAGPLK
jgi:hypothetical protein